MFSRDVIDLQRALESLGVPVWLEGGWGVDARCWGGKRVRTRDLDIVIQAKDVPRPRPFVAGRGYEEITLEPARPHHFGLGAAHAQGHEMDAHVIVLDDQGNGIAGPAVNNEMFPGASLTGTGTD